MASARAKTRKAGSVLLLTALAALSFASFAQHAKHKPSPATPPEPAPMAVQAPVAPPNMLDQPAKPATVTAGNQTLTVKAENSSLTQILHQVSSATGMQLDGLSSDERVFGSFGPGPPGQVLTALLNGTAYNMIMVGDLPSGAPRELLLTHRESSKEPPPSTALAHSTEQDSADDTGTADDPDETPAPPPPVQPQPAVQPSPQQGQRTPQQIIQQQMQMQQQMRNQQSATPPQ